MVLAYTQAHCIPVQQRPTAMAPQTDDDDASSMASTLSSKTISAPRVGDNAPIAGDTMSLAAFVPSAKSLLLAASGDGMDHDGRGGDAGYAAGIEGAAAGSDSDVGSAAESISSSASCGTSFSLCLSRRPRARAWRSACGPPLRPGLRLPAASHCWVNAKPQLTKFEVDY